MLAERLKRLLPAQKIAIRMQPIAVDRVIVGIALALSTIGVVAVYSAGSFLGAGRAGGADAVLMDHTIRLLLGIGLMFLFSQIDYHLIARFSKAAIIASAALLVFVLLQGTDEGGARRAIWGFRPSDLARIALILHVAVLLTQKQLYIEDFWRGFMPITVWIVLIVGLIGVQNLSNALVLLTIVLAMGFIGRIRVLHLGSLIGGGLVLAILMMLVFPERAARLESYLGIKLFSHTDSASVFSIRDEGFQITQAQIAIANGGFSGVGLAKSTQREWLPEAASDFIFAIITEEYGFIGAMVLISLLLVLIYRGFMQVARYAPDPLGFFLAMGISLALGLYGLVHICVNVGLMPVTGLPFPLVSWGGTALMVTGVMLGILLNIASQTAKTIPQEA